MSDGVSHVTVTVAFPALRTTDSGVDGAIKSGVTWFDGYDDVLSPTWFVAITVNVYAVPFVRPVTTEEVAAVLVDTSPGDDTTV